MAPRGARKVPSSGWCLPRLKKALAEEWATVNVNDPMGWSDNMAFAQTKQDTDAGILDNMVLISMNHEYKQCFSPVIGVSITRFSPYFWKSPLVTLYAP